jgi:hypothetical protein
LSIQIERNMKKSIVLAWLGLAVSVAPTFGSGYIMLDNYDTSGPDITYWLPGSVGGPGLQPGGWGGPWTVGLYYAMGDVTKSCPPYYGSDDPGYWGLGFTLGTGPGSTATVYYSAFDTPGEFMANSPFEIAGNPGDTITVVMIAYDGASYAWPTLTFPFDNFPWGWAGRGRSAPFTMTLSDVNSSYYNCVGDFMSGFSVSQAIPEPGILALVGLGVSVLMPVRRKTG